MLKPVAELYDINADRHMIHNLATDPRYAAIVKTMLARVRDWQIKTHDLGLIPESLLHRRSDGTTPFEMGVKLGDRYFATVCDRARRASDREPANIQWLVRGLTDDDDVIRWWSAMGLVMLGGDASAAQDDLKSALVDKSPIVRVAAASALCNLQQYQTALPVLIAALRDPTPFVRLRALNVLDRIGPHARPAIDAIKHATMPKGTIFPADFLNRMCQYVSARLAARP